MDLIGRASNMEMQQKHISQLRFPEFQNNGEWEVKKLSDIVKEVDDKCSISKLQIETYISTENMLQNLEGVKKASKLPETGSFTCFKKGDILFSNIRPYLKKVWLAEFDGAASNDVIVFRVLNDFDCSFVSQIIKSDDFIAYTMTGAKGVKMPRGDKNMMFDYVVCVPTLAEQRRIANTLSEIGTLLSATKGKLEQLKAYKKGLMQKLFPAKGKNFPELHFKEFEKDGEWEEKKLGEITTDIYQPQTISQSQFSTSGYPVYGANGIIGYYALYNHDSDQILVTCRGSSCGTINYSVGKCWITGNAMVINLDSVLDSYDKRFVYYMLLNKDLSRLITGSGQPQIVRAPLLNFEVNITNSIYEQRRIAGCLGSIDEMINQYTNKIALLELYKKGLTQQIFPNSKL